MSNYNIKKEMKKLGLFLIASVISFISLTSCLESSNVSEGYGLGVLQYSSKSYTPVLNSTLGLVSASNLGDMDINSCYYFYYKLDLDLPENAHAVVEANGYQTISILDKIELDKYYLSSSLTDTSRMMNGEVPVYDAYESGNPYIDEYYFISQIVKMPSDLQLTWHMSYDGDGNIAVVENGERYYDVFVRATKRNSSDKTEENVQHLNAYFVRDFLKNAANNERNALGSNYSETSSKLRIRFNFVSEISDEGKLTWKSKTEESVYVGMFLSY